MDINLNIALQLIYSELKKLSFLASSYSSPNPPVACIITDINYQVLSTGYTQKVGQNHAEREAYKNLKTPTPPHYIFVTLSPCTHFGKTPPCLDLILERQPLKLYYGIEDSNPLVSLYDFKQACHLRGIEVIHDETIYQIGLSFLSGFLSRIQKKHPFSIIKTALSQEGFYTTVDKKRVQISNSSSLNLAQLLRAYTDAIIVGPRTTESDNPSLEFRGIETEENHHITQNQSILFETLFRLSQDEKIIEHYNMHKNDYQPFRIYVIGKINSTEFIENQKKIALNSMKSIFCILNDSNILIDKYRFSELKELSHREPFIVEEKNLYKDILNVLEILEINSLLIEGGNLLYKLFTKNQLENLSILKIQSSLNLIQGIKPSLYNISKSLKFEVVVKNDIWRVYH